jgi:hypothetical protein
MGNCTGALVHHGFITFTIALRYGVDGTTDEVPFDLVDTDTLQLDTFRAARTRPQNNEPTVFNDESGDVPSFESGKQYTDGPGQYDLRAIVVHSCHVSTLLDDRHFEYDYVAYVREGTTKTENGNNWLLFDNTEISRVAPSAVPVDKAHMMLYSRDFEYVEDYLFL